MIEIRAVKRRVGLLEPRVRESTGLYAVEADIVDDLHALSLGGRRRCGLDTRFMAPFLGSVPFLSYRGAGSGGNSCRAGLLLADRPGSSEPDAHQCCKRYYDQKAADDQKHCARDLPDIWFWRWRARAELPDYSDDEAEGAEQDENGARRHNKEFRYDLGEKGFCANSTGERR